MSLYNKILGGLIGAGAGDAIGSATEARTTEQILECFGHEVTDFETPPNDTFGAGSKAGQVTDDFSSAYFFGKNIVENNGIITERIIQNALIEWSSHAVFFDRFAGPTTRLAIRQYKGEEINSVSRLNMTSRQATNGAAMRISPIGLLNAGNIEQAIRDAAFVSAITHNNYPAISSACAVAAAVSRAAMCDADVYSVLEAGLLGSREGERIGREHAADAASPSIVKRMEMAIDIGIGKGSLHEKMIELRDTIGTGLHAAEAIPAAFGFFAAGNGQSMETLTAAVNAGYDTDTTATMAGAIAGTLCGADSFPAHFLPVLEERNEMEISKLAAGLTAIAEARLLKAKETEASDNER